MIIARNQYQDCDLVCRSKRDADGIFGTPEIVVFRKERKGVKLS